MLIYMWLSVFFFQAEDGIRDLVRSRGLGDVYKRQIYELLEIFMLFNSLQYAIFLPIVFILYWFVFQKNLKAQNIFIIIVSYIFYGWWDWRFLSLIIFSSAVDYSVGIGLLKIENNVKRKLLLYTSLITNIGLLGVFKNFNFFI